MMRYYPGIGYYPIDEKRTGYYPDIRSYKG